MGHKEQMILIEQILNQSQTSLHRLDYSNIMLKQYHLKMMYNVIVYCVTFKWFNCVIFIRSAQIQNFYTLHLVCITMTSSKCLQECSK